MLFGLDLYQFLLYLAALIILSPLILVLGYLLIIVLFYVSIAILALFGAFAVACMWAVVATYEAIRDWWHDWRTK